MAYRQPLYIQTNDKTVTNDAAEASIVGSGIGNLTLPANFFDVGKTIRIKIAGIYDTPAAATNILFKVKLGSTVIGSVTTSGLASGASDLRWDVESVITCRTVGATGTVYVDGRVQYATGSGTINVDSMNNSADPVTLDTTSSKLIDVTVDWDAASLTRNIRSAVMTVEVLN